ncbi:hypothetical protein ACSBR1_035885 [Camellia fascicularis]
MERSRGVSGIGFDSETGMFQAFNEWWAKMESANKACAKFRKKTLQHRDLMETVFIGALATAKHHWTLGKKVQEADDVSSDSVDSLGVQPFADLIPARVVDIDSDSSLEPVLIVNDKRKQTLSTSCGKSKKATSGASVIAESMNNLTNIVRTQNH